MCAQAANESQSSLRLPSPEQPHQPRPSPAPPSSKNPIFAKASATSLGLPAAAALGFLVAAGIFGRPWHLSLSWGDIPTWLAVVAAAVAGWAAIRQLRNQQRQISDEAARGAKRDELLDRQLETTRRHQAEKVEVRSDLQGPPKAYVYNGSPRPITRITCKILSTYHKNVLAKTEQCEIEGSGKVHRGPYLMRILPGQTGVFSLSELRETARSDPEPTATAYFRDDAGLRWHLDQFLHLVRVDDKGNAS
jgi:hypothetical protein